MAKILGTSTPFLSAVENGKKNIPAEWIERLTDYYGLSPAEKTQLEMSAEESRLQYKIIPGNAGTNQRSAALQFARSIERSDSGGRVIHETSDCNLEVPELGKICSSG